MRLSIHPDLFMMLNHPDPKQLNQSIRDLSHQAALLDLMGLDQGHKIQIHAGERFHGDKAASIDRFVERFALLDDRIKRRVVIENENVLCTVKDCLAIHIRTGLPIVPDVLHHEITAGDEGIHRVLEQCGETWGGCDGPMMVDYSSQQPGKMSGKHAETLNFVHFRSFVEATAGFDFDLMMENKDREKSALEAYNLLKADPRVLRGLRSAPASCEA
jgi:UV DNA damage endonuclease